MTDVNQDASPKSIQEVADILEGRIIVYITKDDTGGMLIFTASGDEEDSQQAALLIEGKSKLILWSKSDEENDHGPVN